MKIKKFESFYPVATKSSLFNYYNCDNCGGLWKEFNKKFTNYCPYCDTDNAKIISEDEWYKNVAERLEPDEVKDLYDEKRRFSEELLDLVALGYAK